MKTPYNDDSLEASESPHALSDWQRFGMDISGDHWIVTTPEVDGDWPPIVQWTSLGTSNAEEDHEQDP